MIYWWQINIWKDATHHMSSGKWKLKQPWDTATYLFEWSKSRTLTTFYADEDEDWEERFYITGSVQFSHSIRSDSLRPHELHHARRPCPSPTPGVHPNPRPLSRWCHSAISSCHPLLLLPSIFTSIRVFSNKSVLHIRLPKYWSFSFSISPSNEYSRLISFTMNSFDLLAVQGTLKSLLQYHISKASILRCSAIFFILAFSILT